MGILIPGSVGGVKVVGKTAQGTKLAEQKFVKTIMDIEGGPKGVNKNIQSEIKPLNIKDVDKIKTDPSKLNASTLDNKRVERDLVTSNKRIADSVNKIKKRDEAVGDVGSAVKDAIKAVGDVINDGF